MYVGGSSDIEKATPESVQERCDVFEAYLQQYFTQVTVVRGAKYKPQMSADYDVTIFDGMVRREQPAIWRKKENGEQLNKEEAYALKTSLPATFEPSSFEEYMKKRLKENYETFGTDYKAYHKYLHTNEPYLYGAGMFYKLIVDEDAKSWKIPNSDIRILDKAIATLEKGKKPEAIFSWSMT